jgi:hypothetical protein
MIKDIQSIINNNKIIWEQKETKEDLFQYNYYMHFFYLFDIDEKLFKEGNNFKLEKNKNHEIWNLTNELIKEIESKYNMISGSAYFVKLNPQQYPLRQYYEFEEYASIINKCYIPIITNSNASLCVDDEIYNNIPGTETIAHKEQLSSLYNFGETDIVYLIIDLIDR